MLRLFSQRIETADQGDAAQIVNGDLFGTYVSSVLEVERSGLPPCLPGRYK